MKIYQIFNFPVPSRILALIVLDVCSSFIAATSILFVSVYMPINLGHITAVAAMVISLILTFCYICIVWYYGGYNIFNIKSVYYEIITILKSIIIIAIISIVILVIIGRHVVPMSYFIYWTLMVFMLSFLSRHTIIRHWRNNARKSRVIILGAGWAGKEIGNALVDTSSMEIEPVGFVDDNVKKTPIEKLPILGTFDEIPNIIEKFKPDYALIAITNHRPNHVLSAVYVLRERGIPVKEMSVFYEQLMYRIPIQHIGANIHLFPSLYNRLDTGVFDIYNRIINIIFSVVLLALCLPVMALIPLVILLDSKGPLLYKQERVGHRNQVFTCLKFRSMVQNAEYENGPVWAVKNDPRITRVGKLLRKARLDELPQLWNVLKGEMNLVGPRPERPEFVEQLRKEIPFYDQRHSIRPGITGWAQVNYRYGNSTEDAIIKLQYDLFYISNRSFFLELIILLKTIPVVLRGGGI